MMIVRFVATLLLVCSPLYAEDWFNFALRQRELVAKPDGKIGSSIPDFGKSNYTIVVWVKTKEDGSLVAVTKHGEWLAQGKSLFIRGGKVCFDIGWVGAVSGNTRVADGEWHCVAFTGGMKQAIYVDGKLDTRGRLSPGKDPQGAFLMVGFTNRDFPGEPYLRGELDELQIYGRHLTEAEIKKIASNPKATATGVIRHWSFDDNLGDRIARKKLNPLRGKPKYPAGKAGKALSLNGKTSICGESTAGAGRPSLVTTLKNKFKDGKSVAEINWCIDAGVLTSDTESISAQVLNDRFQKAIDAISNVKLPVAKRPVGDALLRQAKGTFVAAMMTADLKAELKKIETMAGNIPAIAECRVKIDKFSGSGDFATYKKLKAETSGVLIHAVAKASPGEPFDKIVFVKRLTYSANHYYTEFINSKWTPGGNLCILDLETGKVKELVSQLKGGVFERFDVSYDAKKIAFAWKCDAQEGYRIYEVNVDGTGLRQLTFPPTNEKELQRLYRARPHYHHGTDDMHPCYLPDGGIAFISTRCQYGILCDAPDDFTTTVIYRMDADGKNMQKLSNSSVSEASPVVMQDGRIMYTRWEYLDKGAVSVKCLWAMRPDGGGSSEIYANDIALPPTFIYGRPIPERSNEYVVLGTPHFPQNGIGTVIHLDMSKNIRTREPMTYITGDVDIQTQAGFSFRDEDGKWRPDGQGRGRLFKDPYPLSRDHYLVSHKPAGDDWRSPKGYGLYLLNAKGEVVPIYKDPEISCWLPYPLRPRKRPPVIATPVNPKLAKANKAVCVVVDIYHGMENVKRGEIKYIRVLEQMPRPWSARRRWGGDSYDQQHVTITKDTHLGLKVQHGIVPVEKDGSAHFVVPTNGNVYFQALDENYMAVQTERTFVNYLPGETRSCIGCHETPNSAPANTATKAVLALQRAPSVPGPQPGEKRGQRTLYYARDVQPVWDKHCIKCHAGDKPKGNLNLSGQMTKLFSVSYESLVPERRRRPRCDRGLLGPVIGENHPKTGNVHYLPTRSLGSHASVLVAMLSKGKVKLADPERAKRATFLAEKHKKISLTPEELLRVTNWVDTNCQYYGSWWGRRNLQYKDRPDFRPDCSFEDAISTIPPKLDKETGKR